MNKEICDELAYDCYKKNYSKFKLMKIIIDSQNEVLLSRYLEEYIKDVKNKYKNIDNIRLINIVNLLESFSKIYNKSFEAIKDDTRFSDVLIIKYLYQDQLIIDITDETFFTLFAIKRKYIMDDYINRFANYYLNNRYKNYDLEEKLGINKEHVNLLFKIIKKYYYELYLKIEKHKKFIKNYRNNKNGNIIIDHNMISIVRDNILHVSSYQLKYLEVVATYLENDGDIQLVSNILLLDQQTIYSILIDNKSINLLKSSIVSQLNEYLAYEKELFFGKERNDFIVNFVKQLLNNNGDIEKTSNEFGIPIGVALRLAKDQISSILFGDYIRELLDQAINTYQLSQLKEEDKNVFALKPYRPKTNEKD